MLGWLSDAATCDSRTNRFANAGSAAENALSPLSATRRRRWVWNARWTVAVPPRPISSRISYLPTTVRVTAATSAKASGQRGVARDQLVLLLVVPFPAARLPREVAVARG